MMRRNVMFSSFTLALVLSLAGAARAETASFEVHKLDLWPTRYFTVIDQSGAPTVGMSTSALLAGYTFYDQNYKPFLDAQLDAAPSDAWWKMEDPVTRFLSGFDTLRVADKTGETLGFVRRHHATWHQAKFTLRNAEGRVYANATLNTTATALVVADADEPLRILADMRRLTRFVPDTGAMQDFWRVTVTDTDAVPYDMVRTLATYVSDHQDWFLLWSNINTQAAAVGNSTRNRVVEMSVESAIKNSSMGGWFKH